MKESISIIKLIRRRIFLLILVASTGVTAQNLEKVGKKDMLKISGGLNYNGIYYHAFNKNSTRDPFTWYLNGNVNFSILDWSIPFTYSYSNRQGTYTQPFNQYGLMPTYKWFKGYAGWSNMTFSQYTLSGHVFMGGGAELTPGNWKIAAMYGRMKKANEFDVETMSDANMSYKRMGYGGRVAYEKNGHMLGMNFFRAGDQVNSLRIIPLVTSVRPQENTVISFQAKTTIKKILSIEAEFALSGFTDDVNSEISEVKNYLPLVFTPRFSSQFYKAIKGSASYNHKLFSVALNYERIDPDYKTLGCYFFNNDLENITLAPSFRLLNGRLNLALNTGVQRNNLDGKKQSTNQRIVGSVNLSYAPSEKWTLASSYSNFSTFTRSRPLTDPFYIQTPADTLNIYQLTQCANMVVNHSFGSKERKQSISLSGNYNVSTQQSETHKYQPAVVYSAVSSYNINLSSTKTTIGVTANANESVAAGNTTLFFGPGLNAGQSFAKNTLRLSAGTTYNLSYLNGNSSANVINSRASLNYSPSLKNKKIGKPAISLSMNYMQKLKTATTAESGEFTGTVNLAYSF